MYVSLPFVDPFLNIVLSTTLLLASLFGVTSDVLGTPE